ncbi:MAG: helix-turn-helix transcriptional regulator [Clostridia bacterium]|nr:helix-turn-helix transcriptional regulator [Clostridia bacterium]
MLCNGGNPILEITGVEHMRWKGGTFNVSCRNYSALAFRINGNAIIQSNGNEYNIKTNDILYLPQNMGYTAKYTDTEMLVIHFVTARDDKELEVYSFQNSEQIYKLFLQAHLLWKNKEAGYVVYTMSLLYSILGTILEKETKINLPPYFLKAISYINSNYKNSDLNADTICAEAGIGATAFRQLFKNHYQKTPVEYITDLRLEYARNLISSGMPIENVAYESGFNDPKYFARVVKKRLNCTPRDLKNYGR